MKKILQKLIAMDCRDHSTTLQMVRIHFILYLSKLVMKFDMSSFTMYLFDKSDTFVSCINLLINIEAFLETCFILNLAIFYRLWLHYLKCKTSPRCLL